MASTSLELVEQWRNGTHIMHEANFAAAKRFERNARVLGLITVVLATIVGTAVFKGLSASSSDNARIAAGLASVAAAVLAAMQTFLAYPSLAEKHRAAAHQYGALRRDLERLRTFHRDDPKLEELLTEIERRWNDVDASAPTVPRRIVRGSARRIAESRKAMTPFRTEGVAAGQESTRPDPS